MDLKKRFFSIIVLVVAIGGCGEKKSQLPPAPVTDCESQLAKTAVGEFLAKKFVDEGLKGYSFQDIENILTVSDSVAIKKNGEYYKCNGKISVKFSPELGEKIGSAFSTLKGRKERRIQSRSATRLNEA